MNLLRVSVVVVMLGFASCTRAPAPVAIETEAAQSLAAPPSEKPSEKPESTIESAAAHPSAKPESDKPTPAQAEPNLAELKPWSEERLNDLLSTRVDGGLGGSFRQFSNQFLVMSRLQIGSGVGLIPTSRDVASAELQPVFPESYRPTLRELLDSLAIQAKSTWKYDPTDKHLKSSVPGTVTDLAMFEFTPATREKPFEITLADKWKSEDMGHWLMLVPPNFPVGLDIYEVGTYSADDQTTEAALLAKVRTDVALQWAERVAEKVTAESFQSAKVGEYDALYFEAMIPSQLDKEVRWRQWVFLAGNRCFFVVSTILPELDKTIYPDVKSMLKTFRLKDKQARK